MAKVPITITKNYGGMSPDKKEGPEHSFAYARHLDFRKNSTEISILPRTVKETGTTVTGLITEMLQLPSGKMVAIDDAGGVYVRTTAGSWSKDGTSLPSTAAGMYYNLQFDTIFIPGLTTMHTITNADGRFGGVFTVTADAFVAQVDQSASVHTQIYTTTTSITETSAHKLSFVPAIEPMYSIKVWVTTKGTGDVTATLHDGANNTLATVTKTAASLTDGALNEFVFTVPVRQNVVPNATTYHVHLTHSSGGGGTASTIGTSVASDLSTAHYETYANRFVSPANGWHPAIDFLQYALFGNERYVAVWEPIVPNNPTEGEFLQHKLVFPTGSNVTSFSKWNEYVAIATEKRSTSPTNEFQSGFIYLWDGTSTNPNTIIPVPEGAPYGLGVKNNMLCWTAGGTEFGWTGGEPVPLYQYPNTDSEYTDAEQYIVNYPHTFAVRNNVMMRLFPGITSSTTIEHGVYSYGKRMRNYDNSLGYSYTISTASRTNGTLKLGMLKNFGDKMFISWKDGSNYGVDIVSPTSDPYSSAPYESLVVDNGRPDRRKGAVEIHITFEALPDGATVTPKYKIDRQSTWQNTTGSPKTAVAGDTEITLIINKSYREIQFGYDLAATTTTPKITSCTLIVDTRGSELD